MPSLAQILHETWRCDHFFSDSLPKWEKLNSIDKANWQKVAKVAEEAVREVWVNYYEGDGLGGTLCYED